MLHFDAMRKPPQLLFADEVVTDFRASEGWKFGCRNLI